MNSLKPIIISGPTVTFPLFYKNYLGKWRGIYVDMWTCIANQLGRPLIIDETNLVPGGYAPDSSGIFDGVLGLLQNGSITAAVSNYAPTVDRCTSFKCSSGYNSGPTLEWYIQGGSAILPSFFLQLVNFIPFNPLICCLFAVSFISLNLLRKCAHCLQRWSYGIHVLTSLLFIFSVSLLYNSVFTGNALMGPSIRSIQVPEVLNYLRKGKDYLIVQNIAGLKADDYPVIFDTSTPSDSQLIVESNATKIVNMLCSSDQYIFHDKLFTLSQTNTRRILNFPCPIQRIDTSASLPGYVTDDSMLYTLGSRDSSPVNLYIRNNTKLDKKASFVILAMYDSDKFEGIQYRRYTGFNQMATEDKQTHSYKPLEIGNIYALFAITLYFIYVIYFIVVQSLHSHIFIIEIQYHNISRFGRICFTEAVYFILIFKRKIIH
ncbi:hypothetical protein PRIPAC_94159 [Pristionchus pacificus]|uniref:Uncharacterized protein n=1 Tax=Pristionchus pacificus TaxID=54126 RepID=A0A2A6B497_PRIPA|nr:hypothetical protein PRIPAC_94159 [Pristionchus pacificus]|eukprot:PDM60702.1 hypothetical protein PRIPAC_53971 [Pristionchus pacificus]